jgi:hypothetical protein
MSKIRTYNKVIIALFVCLSSLFIYKDLSFKQLSQISNLYINYLKSGYYFSNYEKLVQLDFIDETTLENGLNNIKNAKVVFVGITRDNSQDLPVVIKHIEALGKEFLDYAAIIYENDSKDNTKKLLKEWQLRNNRVNIISENFGNKKRPSILFLAEARNKYLDLLMKDNRFKDYDFVIVLDMDMSYGFDIRGVLNSFSQVEKWDIICANGIYTSLGNMYDAFAFRSEEMSRLTNGKSIKQVKKIMQAPYDPKGKLIPVESCFGSLAIYKKEYLQNCRYNSLEGDCEHVFLNNCARNKNNAKIMFNPAMVVRYTNFKWLPKNRYAD